MEEILNKEIYAAHSSPDDIFGYTDRYDSYRRKRNKVTGEFANGGGLEHWTMSRVFSGDPALNSSFVTCNPTNRIYSSTSTDQLLVMVHNSIQARRIVHKTGRPMGSL